MVRPPFHRSSWHNILPTSRPSADTLTWSPHSGQPQVHCVPDPFSTYLIQPTQHSPTALLCCFTHWSHNQAPLLCLYFPTKTASEMYALCFWAWLRPKATPRPNPQPLTSSPPKASWGSMKGKVSGLEGRRRNAALGVVFGQGIIYYVFCVFFFFSSNTVFPFSCLSDPRQIFSWGFRSPCSRWSRSVKQKPNVHRIQLLCIPVALWLSCVSVAVSSGKLSEVERLFCSSHISSAVQDCFSLTFCVVLYTFAAHLALGADA